MQPFNSRVDGLRYDAILLALVTRAREAGAGEETDPLGRAGTAGPNSDPTNPNLGGDRTSAVHRNGYGTMGLVPDETDVGFHEGINSQQGGELR